MKHKTIHEPAKCKITKPLVCPTNIVINKLMTLKTDTTYPDLRFMKNTLF